MASRIWFLALITISICKYPDKELSLCMKLKLPPGNFRAYLFDCEIAIVCRLSKPDNYSVCLTIDLCYKLNLVFFLLIIFLVNANGIYPYDSFNRAMSKT